MELKEKMTGEELKQFLAKKHTRKPNGANQLTNDIVRYLNMQEGFTWRNNSGVIFDVRAAAKKLVSQITTWVNRRTIPTWQEVEKLLRQCFRVGSGERGESDIFCVSKRDSGLFIAIEVKYGKDKLSVHQVEFLNSVRRSGGLPIVAGSLDDVIDAISNHRNGKKVEIITHSK